MLAIGTMLASDLPEILILSTEYVMTVHLDTDKLRLDPNCRSPKTKNARYSRGPTPYADGRQYLSLKRLIVRTASHMPKQE
jgi:hypothetical protein